MGEPDIILTYLRRFDERLTACGDDLRDIKTKIGLVEQRVSLIEQRIGLVEQRLDRIETRLDRIERRLDLVETPSPT